MVTARAAATVTMERLPPQVECWDGYFRARNGQAAEWLCEWTDLQGFLAMLVPKARPVLVAGCGNSELSAHMYDAGWHSIVNVDFSKVVIAEMLRLHVRSRPHMRWQVMDITHLLQVTPPFSSSSTPDL